MQFNTIKEMCWLIYPALTKVQSCTKCYIMCRQIFFVKNLMTLYSMAKS